MIHGWCLSSCLIVFTTWEPCNQQPQNSTPLFILSSSYQFLVVSCGLIVFSLWKLYSFLIKCNQVSQWYISPCYVCSVQVDIIMMLYFCSYALPLIKAKAVAQETLLIWCFLASRLGLWALKAELEDLCFAVLQVCFQYLWTLWICLRFRYERYCPK